MDDAGEGSGGPTPTPPQPGGRRSVASLEGDYAASSAGTAPSGEKGAEAGALGDAAARGAAAALTEAPAREAPLPPPRRPGCWPSRGYPGCPI